MQISTYIGVAVGVAPFGFEQRMAAFVAEAADLVLEATLRCRVNDRDYDDCRLTRYCSVPLVAMKQRAAGSRHLMRVGRLQSVEMVVLVLVRVSQARQRRASIVTARLEKTSAASNEMCIVELDVGRLRTG